MRPEVKKIALAENEKAIFDILNKEKSMQLIELKSQTNLSGKQWDLGVKALTKMGLVQVSKVNEELIIDLIEK